MRKEVNHFVLPILLTGLFLLCFIAYFHSIPARTIHYLAMDTPTGYAMGDGSRVARNVSGNYVAPGQSIGVNLVVTIGTGTHTYYALEEYVPSGWTITSSNTPSNILKYAVVNNTAQAPSRTYQYTVTAPATPGNYSWTGTYWIEGMTAAAATEGQTWVVVQGISGEICNNRDDDLDGSVDEGNTPENCSYVCTSASFNFNATRSGILKCCGNDAGEAGPYQATESTCDGRDNDCDGTTDEGSDADACQSRCLNLSYNYNASRSTNLRCCGDDTNEGTPFQSLETNCTDGRDNDCDGLIDALDIGSCFTYYRDADQDSYGNLTRTVVASVQPSGYVTNSLDCNDASASVKPGATEVCDGIDNNCVNGIDEMRSSDPVNCGVCGRICQLSHVQVNTCVNSQCTIGSCSSGYQNLNGNVTDGCEYQCTQNNNVDICDGVDNDCDGTTDEGFTAENCSFKCTASGGKDYSASRASGLKCCGDNTGEDNPFQASESSCDGRDNNCDGNTDEMKLTDSTNCGQCNYTCALQNVAVHSCTAGVCGILTCKSGFVNRNNNSIDGCEYNCTPSSATELCDGIDNNCNGQTDEGFTAENCPEVCLAQGGENYDSSRTNKCCGNNPGEAYPYETTEVTCDGKDNNCDGAIDELTQTSVSNCGSCGVQCSLSNVLTYRCTQGTCGINTCSQGYMDRDGNTSNGCEAVCQATGAETCDGADNDCDGTTDEGFDAQDCEEKCRSDGGADYDPLRREKCCGDDGLEANPYETVEKSCDGYDNDCDGTRDEGCSSGGGGGGGSGGGGGGGGSTTGTVQPSGVCVPLWSCTEWLSCSVQGVRQRTCTDANICGVETAKPGEMESCTYGGTCGDGLMNSDEEGIDCGGRCTTRCNVLSTDERPLVRITADEIWARPLQRYVLNVTVTNVGERTAENLQVSLDRWVDAPQTIDNLLPGDAATISFTFTIPASVTDPLNVQILSRGVAVALEAIPVTIELPSYSLALVDQNGSFYTVLVVNNIDQGTRRIDYEYSVSKDGETFAFDTVRNVDVEQGKVYEKYQPLAVRALPAGTYEIKGTFYEQGKKLSETESTIIIESGRASFDMRYIFYGLLAVIVIISCIVFYSSVKKR
jgi:hypothetical protein